MITRSPRDCGVQCDLCGSNKFRMLHEWPVGDFWNPATIPLSIWQCLACRLILLHPVPTPEQLPSAGDWWSPKKPDYRRHMWYKKPWQRLRYAISDPRDRLIRATSKAVSSGRLLDVGCGKGEVLSLARKFYDCVGVEPSPQAAAATRDRGIQVIENTFEQAEIERSSFDVVVMDSVIEHVQSPMRVLEKVNSILRMQGVVALKTPKYGGPAYRWHGATWNGFRHGYHTFLFTGDTLGQFLKRAGFEVLRRPRRDRMLDDILALWGRKTREAGVASAAPPAAA